MSENRDFRGRSDFTLSVRFGSGASNKLGIFGAGGNVGAPNAARFCKKVK